MDAVNKHRLLWLVAVFLLPLRLLCAGSPVPAIMGHEGLLLNRDFPGSDTSYLLLDARNSDVLAARWAGAEREIPVGSLVKPFTALTYAQSHKFAFPQFTCTESCWLPRGHGSLGIVQAVAQSCNSYFTALGREVRAADVIVTARQFGLRGPAIDAGAEALAGRLGVWRETPLALARAYAEIFRRRAQPGMRDICQGMSLSARGGTAQGIAKSVAGISVFAKTGTAPCTHKPHAPGDGFAIAAWPTENPRYVLLVRQHGMPGSQAAVIVGKMIRLLERQP